MPTGGTTESARKCWITRRKHFGLSGGNIATSGRNYIHYTPEGKKIVLWHNKKNCELRKHYGLSVGSAEFMLTLQAYKCAICRKEIALFQTKGGEGKVRAVIDHNHTTGQVRGILCPKCNLVLTLLEDQKWLFASGKYLMEGLLANAS